MVGLVLNGGETEGRKICKMKYKIRVGETKFDKVTYKGMPEKVD